MGPRNREHHYFTDDQFHALVKILLFCLIRPAKSEKQNINLVWPKAHIRIHYVDTWNSKNAHKIARTFTIFLLHAGSQVLLDFLLFATTNCPQ